MVAAYWLPFIIIVWEKPSMLEYRNAAKRPQSWVGVGGGFLALSLGGHQGFLAFVICK